MNEMTTRNDYLDVVTIPEVDYNPITITYEAC